MLRLNVVISAIGAILIIITAIITLVLMDTNAMKALRQLGTRHAESLVATASSDVLGFVESQLDIITKMNLRAKKGTALLPSDYPNATYNRVWERMWGDEFHIQVASLNWTTGFIAIGFWDGTIMRQEVLPTLPPGTFMTLNGGTPGWAQNNSLQVHLQSTGAAITPKTPMPQFTFDHRLLYVVRTYMAANNTPVWVMEVGSTSHDGMLSVLAPLTNASGFELGALMVGIRLPKFKPFLQSLKLTDNAEIHILDSNFWIMATSTDNVVLNTTYTLNINASERAQRIVELTAPYGCFSNGAAIPTIHCKKDPTNYGDPALLQLYTDHRSLFRSYPDPANPGPAHRLTLAGERYYVVIDTVRASVTQGMGWYFTLLLPEKDVIGNVAKARNTAIGVVCAVCVVAVAVLMLFVTVVLSPLPRIGARMSDAADFADSDEPESTSIFTEIGVLQTSFMELKSKMNTLKGFVPQAILRALETGDEEDEEGFEEEFKDGQTRGHMESSETRSNRSARSHRSQLSKSHRSSKSGGSKGVAAAGATTVGVSSKRVCVLMVNLEGFNDAVKRRSDLMGDYAKLLEEVEGVVHKQRGVIDAFSGDRFFITFNASVAAHSTEKRAAIVALHIREAVQSQGWGQAYMGIDASLCTCGNMGSNTLKRFNVIGAAVKNANFLCTMSKVVSKLQGSNISILAGGACFEALDLEMQLTPMDYIPSVKTVFSLVGLKKMEEGEWMYQLEEGQANKTVSSILLDVFRVLHRSDRTGAEADIKSLFGGLDSAIKAQEEQHKCSAAEAHGIRRAMALVKVFVPELEGTTVVAPASTVEAPTSLWFPETDGYFALEYATERDRK